MSLRQRLLNGGLSYGPLILSDSPVAAEILALTGYGHIVIDHEHSPTNVNSGQRLLQAIQAAQVTAVDEGRERTEAIVRLPGHDTVYMKKVLDSMSLPGGVLVPMVDDEKTARAVIESTRYPRQLHLPLSTMDGVRGCAAPFVRGSRWGRTNTPDYIKKCEEDLLVMVQVESVQGVEAIPQIAAVEGVDGIFLGPFDLSCSLGKMGLFDDPQVRGLIEEAEEAILANDCLLAGFQVPGRTREDMFSKGYSLVCGSVDVGLLRDAALADMKDAQDAIRRVEERK